MTSKYNIDYLIQNNSKEPVVIDTNGNTIFWKETSIFQFAGMWDGH